MKQQELIFSYYADKLLETFARKWKVTVFQPFH